MARVIETRHGEGGTRGARFFWTTPVGLAGLLAALFVSRPASAQSPAATALLDQGREALAAGDLETACARFREAHQQDPSHSGPAASLGKCEEQRGHLAHAWAAYREAIGRMSDGDPQRAVLEGLVKALEPRLPKIVLDLPPETPEGTTVTDGGESLSASGGPVPVDPGMHRLVVQAPSRADRVIEVTVGEGETKHVSVEAGPAGPPGPPSMFPPPLLPIAGASHDTPGTSVSPGPYVVIGIGAASFVVSAVAGALLLHQKTLNDAGCNVVTNTCTASARAAADAGRTLGAVTTATLITGAAGVAGGAIWLGLSKPSRPVPVTGIGVGSLAGGATVRLQGAW
jgi:hypothetical protein